MNNGRTKELIGIRIRKAREKMGWSQIELAAKIGREANNVSQYESGNRSLKITDLPQLAKVLQVSIAYFFGEDELTGAITAFAQQLHKPNRRLLLSKAEHLLEVQTAEKNQIHYQNKRIQTLISAIDHAQDMKSIKQLLDNYRAETSADNQTPKAMPADFTIYTLFENDKSFTGYHFNEKWNGWACPYFTKEVAEDLLRNCETEGTRWHYSKEFDSYVVFDEDAPADYAGDIYQGSLIRNENGEELKVYPIGAFSWVWETVETQSTETTN